MRLGYMAAIESIDRNLATEDAAYERDIKRHEKEMFEGGPEQVEMGDEMGDAMRIMAARDVYVNQPPEISAPTNPPSATTRKAVGTLGKAALAAAILGSGAGAGGAAMWALGKLSSPPVVESADQNTQYEARIRVR